MSKTSKDLMGSDFHIGHGTVHKWRPFKNARHHTTYMIMLLLYYCRTVNTLQNNGDFIFVKEFIEPVSNIIRVYKKMIYVPGNHCFERVSFKHHSYLFFNNVTMSPLIKRFGVWMSHAPITTNQLRGKYNAHGHVHQENEVDPLYFNLSLESEFMRFNLRTKEEMFASISYRESTAFDLSKSIPNHYNENASEVSFRRQLGMIMSDPMTRALYQHSLNVVNSEDNDIYLTFDVFIETLTKCNTIDLMSNYANRFIKMIDALALTVTITEDEAFEIVKDNLNLHTETNKEGSTDDQS